MAKLQVKHLRQDAVNDYFEVWYGSEPDYRTYPRSMGMTEEQLLEEEQEKIDKHRKQGVEKTIDELVLKYGRHNGSKELQESMKSDIIKILL